MTTSPEAAPAAEVRETRPQRQEFTSPERGGYVIAPGLTMADLYRVIYDRLEYCVGELPESANSAVHAKLTELTDGDALCQRACVEIEKLLGIYPNIDGSADPDDPPKWSRNRALARATQQGPAMSDWIERQAAREFAAEAEAQRFLLKLKALRTARGGEPGTHPRETGALRRASLDLTRALADLRRPL